MMDFPAISICNMKIGAVVNMCDEYPGPISKYRKLDIDHIRFRTVDHFEPTLDDLKDAVIFLLQNEKIGKRVYVHCRAGHGRSGAVALAWLMYKNPLTDPQTLNRELCHKRNVRKSLYRQDNIIALHDWFKHQRR